VTVALADLRDEVVIEEFIHIVIGLPAPFGAGERVVYILRPGIDDALAARIGLEGDLRAGEGWWPLRNSRAVRLKLAML